MINGGLERLDPHSAYINPKEYKQFNTQEQGQVRRRRHPDRHRSASRGQLTVISPMVGTPAYEAGVLAGDVIVKIDGKSTENMRLSEAVDLIQGDPGTEDHPDRPPRGRQGAGRHRDRPAPRSRCRASWATSRKADNPKEWDFFIDKDEQDRLHPPDRLQREHRRRADARRSSSCSKDGVRGLVLDLRNNPGGLLRAGRRDQRPVPDRGPHRQHQGPQPARTRSTTPSRKARCCRRPRTIPIAILVNRYSASASEIVAAALQDHDRAVIIGERSYGKGSVQNIIEMENDTSALKLTTASYWRPSGKNIHRFPDSKESDEWGVKPDPGFEVHTQGARTGWNSTAGARPRHGPRQGRRAPEQGETRQGEEEAVRGSHAEEGAGVPPRRDAEIVAGAQ